MSQRIATQASFEKYRMHALELMRIYRSDQAHCERVMRFSAQIFELLRARQTTDSQNLHKNESALLLRLILAAWLHDVGHFINDVGHHKHSRYIIETARQTMDWDTTLRTDVGSLAFTHRKKAERSWLTTHFANRKELYQLSAILRIADGLDRQHADGVTIIGGQFEEENYVLQIAGLKEAYAKRMIEKKADAWKFAFGHSLALKTLRIP